MPARRSADRVVIGREQPVIPQKCACSPNFSSAWRPIEPQSRGATQSVSTACARFTLVRAAQSLASSTVVAQVPFDFMVSNKIIPAGACEVGSVGMDGQILAIRNFDARKSALATSFQDRAKQTADSTVLVFNHYGNQYFLSEIRLEGSNQTYKLPESRTEAELCAENSRTCTSERNDSSARLCQRQTNKSRRFRRPIDM